MYQYELCHKTYKQDIQTRYTKQDIQQERDKTYIQDIQTRRRTLLVHMYLQFMNILCACNKVCLPLGNFGTRSLHQATVSDARTVQQFPSRRMA